MDRACVIGYGVVGQATAKVFGIKKHFDVQEERSNMSMSEVAACEFIFICIPTPVFPDGSYNTKDISDLINSVEELGSGATYIIRSTVFPGFAMHLQETLDMGRIISNPEFLTEATAEKDSKYPPFILLGGLPGRFLDNVKAIYEGRIKSAPVILTDNTTAELAKLSMNGYFSTKVIFANQIYDAAKKLGANYETIKKVLGSHPFGPKNHFTIWFNGKRGVHGKCLPKDTQALAHYTSLDLIDKVNELNQQYIGERDNG